MADSATISEISAEEHAACIWNHMSEEEKEPYRLIASSSTFPPCLSLKTCPKPKKRKRSRSKSRRKSKCKGRRSRKRSRRSSKRRRRRSKKSRSRSKKSCGCSRKRRVRKRRSKSKSKKVRCRCHDKPQKKKGGRKCVSQPPRSARRSFSPNYIE